LFFPEKLLSDGVSNSTLYDITLLKKNIIPKSIQGIYTQSKNIDIIFTEISTPDE